MIVLIWVALLSCSAAETGASDEKQHCDRNGYCVTLTEGEITAEAGLCVVIPCSFTTAFGFRPETIIWFKCEPDSKRCDDSDLIFHSNKNNQNIQSGFRRRVSLLDPDVRNKNCSIIINDLRETDSGSYQLRVNGEYFGRPDGYTFDPKATVSVKGLTQKPSVIIPSLTDGQRTTLTCTAPGLCSGSPPTISWKWRRTRGNVSRITGNITAFQTESLTAGRQRHSSTLTFNASAEHHGTKITCKVHFTGRLSTEETLALNVSYVKDLQITGETRVKEGESLTLNCSVESFPPSVPTWTKSMNENMQNGTEAALQNGTEAHLQDESGLSSFTISNVTVEDSGQYICTAKHLKEIVNVTVIYKRKPRITGDATVKGGGVLNLTCSAESFPPSLIMWRKLPTQDSTTSNIQLHNGTDGVLHSDTGSATLIIPNAKANDSGQYVCTAKHLDTTVAVYADVTVTWFSIVRNGSGCVVESEVLTCVCKSEGFPLPTIQWPLLRKHADYSVNTNVSNHAVSSTLILTAKNLGNEAVECFSSNDNENATESIPVQKKPSDLGGTSQKVFDVVSRLEIIIAFLSGVLFSAFFCCFAQKCYRRKQKESGHLDETLEMVTSQDDPAVSDGQAEQDDQTHAPEGAENGAVAAEKAAPEHNSGPKDVEYASINFSRLRRRSPREAARRKESTETEYAEIKREVKEERGDEGDGGEGEMLAGEKGEVVMEEEEEEEEEAEAKPREAEEEKEEEEAVYSNVKDIMDEI